VFKDVDSSCEIYCIILNFNVAKLIFIEALIRIFLNLYHFLYHDYEKTLKLAVYMNYATDLCYGGASIYLMSGIYVILSYNECYEKITINTINVFLMAFYGLGSALVLLLLII